LSACNTILFCATLDRQEQIAASKISFFMTEVSI
jgi:hypothetical protein